MAEVTSLQTQRGGGGPWWKEMSRYHWLVLAIASLSWLFDCMDQRFFNIAREPAMRSLLYGAETNAALEDPLTAEQKSTVKFYGRLATAMVLAGWAVGGFFFGLCGDRIGRVRTMMITIVIYAGFTGLSAISFRWWDFIIYRFLMGLGVGGLFAAAVSLVAEVTPPRARPHALGLLQALSAIGNVTGSAISLGLQPKTTGWLGVENWRWLFLVGIFPALLVVAIQKTLKEPESWRLAKTRAAADLQKQLGAWGDLFLPGLRRNTLVGLGLATAGVVGLWAVGFFSPELIYDTFERSKQGRFVAFGTMLQDVGSFFGIYFFTTMAARFGRKPAFGLCFLMAYLATVMTFYFLRRESDIYWMLPILGFWNLSVFGGYAIYFPELYPTRLRSTGIGFCYNVGRILTAVGFILFAFMDLLLPFRTVSIIIASIYFLGLAVLPWAIETKGKPLPE